MVRSSDQPVTGTIHQAFSERTRLDPTEIAVSSKSGRLTYLELDCKSNQLAGFLHSQGINAASRVGICLDRSPDLITSALAVLKVGATYVPIDSSNPSLRVEQIVEDADLVGIVMCNETAELLVEVTVPTINLDSTLGKIASFPISWTPPHVDPISPAYIIFTSGSTGRPKGVVVPHCNVLSLVAATSGYFQLHQTDVWTMFHSFGFDFSVWEMWGSLLTGGRLVVVPLWTARDPMQFLALCQEEGVTILNLTPTAFTLFVREAASSPERLKVRLLILGGEPLIHSSVLAWMNEYPESYCKTVNMYGITEATVHVTALVLTREDALERSRSVGRPIDGWGVIILNAEGEPAPLGAIGEIGVTGAGLAIEYLGRADLTRERFIQVRSPVDGQMVRVYRSGDRGRLSSQGELEHLGRLDRQVKIRGFRVELDEIEIAMAKDPTVLACVVTTRERGGDAKGLYPSSTRLDAYVVATEGASSKSILRELRTHLPAYMIPETVTLLERFPTSRNGKILVDKLPIPRSHGSAE